MKHLNKPNKLRYCESSAKLLSEIIKPLRLEAGHTPAPTIKPQDLRKQMWTELKEINKYLGEEMTLKWQDASVDILTEMLIGVREDKEFHDSFYTSNIVKEVKQVEEPPFTKIDCSGYVPIDWHTRLTKTEKSDCNNKLIRMYKRKVEIKFTSKYKPKNKVKSNSIRDNKPIEKQYIKKITMADNVDPLTNLIASLNITSNFDKDQIQVFKIFIPNLTTVLQLLPGDSEIVLAILNGLRPRVLSQVNRSKMPNPKFIFNLFFSNPTDNVVRSSFKVNLNNFNDVWDDKTKLFEEQYDDGSVLREIQVLVSQKSIIGGCASDHKRHITNSYKLHSFKSFNNNCAIQVFKKGSKSTDKKRPKSIRKILDLGDGMIDQDGLVKLADYYKCGFKLYLINNSKFKEEMSHNTNLKTIEILLSMKHYMLMEDLKDKKKEKCAHCGVKVFKTDDHVCNRNVARYNKRFHDKNKVTVPKKKNKWFKDDVIIFDCETFPINGKHTAYAVGLDDGEYKMSYGKNCWDQILDMCDEKIELEDTKVGLYDAVIIGKKKYIYQDDFTFEKAMDKAKSLMKDHHTLDIDKEKKQIKIIAGKKTWRNIKYGLPTRSEVIAKINKKHTSELYKKRILVAHNGSGFDNFIMFPEILKRGHVPDILVNNGRILQMKWNNTEVWDSYRFVSSSLKKLAKNFQCDVQKGDFDHKLMKSWSDVDKYKNDAPKSSVNPNGMGWDPYLKCDVMSLKEITFKVANMMEEHFDKDVFQYMTISSLGYEIASEYIQNEGYHVEIPENEDYDYIKQATFGGRCIPITRQFNVKDPAELWNVIKPVIDVLEVGDDASKEKELIKEDIKELYKKYYDSGDFLWNGDVNSLYPYAMLENYPVGEGIMDYYAGEEIYKSGKLGFFDIIFTPPKDLMMAILPVRKRPWKANMTAKENKRWLSSGIKWSLESGIGTYTSVDIMIALRRGYKIRFTGKCYYYGESAPILKEYIEHVYKIKTDQGVKKKQAKKLVLDGMSLNEAAKESGYNPALRQAAKDLTNCVYGKLLQKMNVNGHEIVEDGDQFFNFLEKYDLSCFNVIDEDHLLLEGDKYDKKNTKPAQCGAFVLAYSRMFMDEAYSSATDNYKKVTITYTDTDSLHMHGSVYKKLLKDKPEMFDDVVIGKLANDIDGYNPIIIKEVALGPKSYMYIWIDKNGDIGLTRKTKGIRHADMNKITVEEFEKKKSKLIKFDSMKRNFKSDIGIKNTVMSRTFSKNDWEGAELIGNIYAPFGYNKESNVKGGIEESNIKFNLKRHKKYTPKTIKGPGKEFNWYMKLLPAEHLPWDGIIIKWVEKPYKKYRHYFTKVPRDDFLNAIEYYRDKKKTSHFYEVLSGDMRLYCDVNFKGWKGDPNLIVEDFIECMCEASSEMGVEMNSDELNIIDSSSIDEISFQIIHKDHIFETTYHQKGYWEEVRKLTLHYPNLVKDGRSILNDGVYCNNKSMMSILSKSDRGSQRVLYHPDKVYRRLSRKKTTHQLLCDHLLTPKTIVKYSKLSVEPSINDRAKFKRKYRSKRCVIPHVKNKSKSSKIVNGTLMSGEDLKMWNLMMC